MMRRLCLLLLILCFAASCAAGAPQEPLQAAELRAWQNALWNALSDMPLENNPSVTHDEEASDRWLYAFAFGMVVLTTPTRDSDPSALVEVELLTGDIPCPRGLRVGNTLEDVLSAYPNDNPDLKGTTGYAALYVHDTDAEGSMGWGWLLRRNQNMEAVSYTVSVPAQGMAGFRQEYTVSYVFLADKVNSIVVSGFGNLLTQAESAANLAAVRDVATQDSFAAGAVDPAGFTGDDLTFAGLSFVSASPEDVLKTLGDPLSDELDETEGIRTLTYADALVEYMQLGGRWRASALLVSADTIAGPRGLRVGDTHDSVLARFGDGGQDDVLTYQYTDAGGQTYLLSCAFVDGILTEYLLHRL